MTTNAKRRKILDDEFVDTEENCRYHKLSSQLFGLPCINLADDRKRKRSRGNDEESLSILKEEKFREKARCLICYSALVETKITAKIKNEVDRHIEKSEFERIFLQNSVKTVQEDVASGHCGGGREEAIKRLSLNRSSSKCLCHSCNTAFEQFLRKQRAIIKLQKEVNEMRLKFVAAIQLSTAFAEQDLNLGKWDFEGHCSNAVAVRMQTVDIIRKCLLGNTRTDTALMESESELMNLPERCAVSEGTFEGDEFDQQEDFVGSSPCQQIAVPVQEAENGTLLLSSIEDISAGEKSCSRRKSQKMDLEGMATGETDWREIGGQLFFRNVEVQKNSDDKYLCPFKKCEESSSKFTRKHAIICHVKTFHDDEDSNEDNAGVTCDGDPLGDADTQTCTKSSLIEDQPEKEYFMNDFSVNLRHLNILGVNYAGDTGSTDHERQATESEPIFSWSENEEFPVFDPIDIKVDVIDNVDKLKDHADIGKNKKITGKYSQLAKLSKWNAAEELITGINFPSSAPAPYLSENESKINGIPKKRLRPHDSQSREDDKKRNELSSGTNQRTCKHCNKQFDRIANLKVHLKTHTGERPFPCHICAYSGVQKAHLQKHIRSRHQQAMGSKEIC